MNENENCPPSGGKKRKTLLIVLLVLVGALLLSGALTLVYLHRWRSGQWTPSPALKKFVREVADVDGLRDKARALKDDMTELAAQLKEQDLDAAEETRARMRLDMETLRREMDAPLFSAAAISPDLRAEIEGAEELLAILDEADEALIGPALALLREQPLSGLSDENGIRTEPLGLYLDFIEGALPQAEALMARAQNVDLRLMDEDGKLKKAQKKLGALQESLDEFKSWLPAIRALLGDGSDRLYLFAAQNSSEIRASGGFPGSMGLIRIRDGRLTVSDFQSVYNVITRGTPGRACLTQEEIDLFTTRMTYSWDADFCPDFERVASIWAMAYEDYHREPVDGVISCTPAVIPRLLAILGKVELSDGTELNGENAGRVLGRDLYFRYLGAARQQNAAAVVDGLFSEAARSTLSLLFSKLNAKTLSALIPLFRECIGDRTLMFWLADEAEQELVRAVGWDAGLNRDPARPCAGVFFNCSVASKMGWFLDLETELSEPEPNEDGSQSYTLTVRLTNTITPQEMQEAGGYILGDRSGITGILYVFAPAGGRVEPVNDAGGLPMKTGTYKGLQVAYRMPVSVGSVPLEFTCRITTAPEAEEPLALMTTPTMQAFR